MCLFVFDIKDKKNDNNNNKRKSIKQNFDLILQVG